MFIPPYSITCVALSKTFHLQKRTLSPEWILVLIPNPSSYYCVAKILQQFPWWFCPVLILLTLLFLSLEAVRTVHEHLHPFYMSSLFLILLTVCYSAASFPDVTDDPFLVSNLSEVNQFPLNSLSNSSLWSTGCTAQINTSNTTLNPTPFSLVLPTPWLFWIPQFISKTPFLTHTHLPSSVIELNYVEVISHL